jgi:hypothetical protein
MPCGLIPDGRDLPVARIQRLLAGILPKISFHASSLSVPGDRAGPAIGSIERNHVPQHRQEGPPGSHDPDGPLSVPESNAPRTGPSSGGGPQNVPIFGSDHTRSRDRGRMFPFVQTAKSPGGVPGRQLKFPHYPVKRRQAGSLLLASVRVTGEGGRFPRRQPCYPAHSLSLASTNDAPCFVSPTATPARAPTIQPM